MKLTISVLGGAKYDLKDKRINRRGHSQAFGAIHSEYNNEVNDMLKMLVKREEFSGFEV